MPKIVSIFTSLAWVKNVYSLRTDSGVNSVYTSLSYTAPLYTNPTIRAQLPRFTQVTTFLSSALSTLKNLFQPLLITDLYLVSTAPTMKKKKENKERNS